MHWLGLLNRSLRSRPWSQLQYNMIAPDRVYRRDLKPLFMHTIAIVMSKEVKEKIRTPTYIFPFIVQEYLVMHGSSWQINFKNEYSINCLWKDKQKIALYCAKFRKDYQSCIIRLMPWIWNLKIQMHNTFYISVSS